MQKMLFSSVVLLCFINLGTCIKCYIGQDDDMVLHDSIAGAVQGIAETLTKGLAGLDTKGSLEGMGDLGSEETFKTCAKMVDTSSGSAVVMRSGMTEDLGISGCSEMGNVQTCLCNTNACNTAATSGVILLPILILPLLIAKVI